MRSFILGGLLASVLWVFVSLGGNQRIVDVWQKYQSAQMMAQAERLATERAQAFSENYRPVQECSRPSGELKRLECRNREEMARASFYAQWNRTHAGRFPQ